MEKDCKFHAKQSVNLEQHMDNGLFLLFLLQWWQHIF